MTVGAVERFDSRFTGPTASRRTYQPGSPLVHYKFNQGAGANLIGYGSQDADLTPDAANPTTGIAGRDDFVSGCESAATTQRFYNAAAATTVAISTNDFVVSIEMKQPVITVRSGQYWQWLLHNPSNNCYFAGWMNGAGLDYSFHFRGTDGTVHEPHAAKAELYDKLLAGPKQLVLQVPRSGSSLIVLLDDAPVALTLPGTTDYAETNHVLSDLAAHNITFTTGRYMLGYSGTGMVDMWEFWLALGLSYTSFS